MSLGPVNNRNKSSLATYKDPNGFDDYIQLPDELINNYDIEKLIKCIYPTITSMYYIIYYFYIN